MTESIHIAIASGKGGTGKTTLAANLAVLLSEQDNDVAYLDCDVEEPNGHIFLNPVFSSKNQVTIPVPEVNDSRCNYCRACSDACRFSAILVLKEKVLTFPKLCHGCGGCSLACSEHAIQEIPRSIGFIEEGMTGKARFIHGRLKIGEAMSPPVIRAVRTCVEAEAKNRIVIIDSPPGTSCPVIESVKGSDVVLLVTEPTPFGLNDLKLAVEMVRTLGVPYGVAVNRVGVGSRDVFAYCGQENIPVLLELPDDRRIAESYSRGELVIKTLPELKPLFAGLGKGLFDLAACIHPPSILPSKPKQISEKSAQFPSEGLPPGDSAEISELVVISGKGGTGKTSVLASFFSLSNKAAVVDCDVDAADLHLVLNPKIQKCWPFSGGCEAKIDIEMCDKCGSCLEHCRFNAIKTTHHDEGRIIFRVDPFACEGCGICKDICPVGAVQFNPSLNGEWFVSDTRYGPMVHAKLGIAQENSGKLVSLIRREARAVAVAEGRNLLLSDGSPGVGCSVIASITGVHMALIVTEPSLTGIHDMKRVAELTHHFKVNTAICINKFDINPDLAGQLEQEAKDMGLSVLGRIHYDPAVTWAQVQGKTVVDCETSPAAKDIRELWERVKDAIK